MRTATRGPRAGTAAFGLVAAAALGLGLACDKQPEKKAASAGAAGSGPVTLPALSAAGLATASRADPQVTMGARSYAKYCALCHGVDAKGYAADHAPSLISKTFLESASDDFLTTAIRDGRPRSAMAAYGRDRGGPLSDAELSAVVGFLRAQGPATIALPESPRKGDAASGQTTYEAVCKRCHGTPETPGDAVHLGNSALLGSASDAFLRHAIVNGRPGTPMVSFAATLSEQQIDDVVAHLRSWAPFQAPKLPVVEAPAAPMGPVVINPKGGAPAFTLREDRYVPIDQVKKALDAKKKLVIIDARAASEWLTLRIPDSISVPYYEMKGLDAVSNDGTWVLAYCACPHHASGVIVDELKKRGFKHTAILDEGVLEWNKRHYPVAGTTVGAASASSGTTSPKAPGSTSPRPAPHPH